MAALLALPGYRYPITTCRSAPPPAKGSKVFARIPGWFSTSFRQSVMDFTVTGIALLLPRVSRAGSPFLQAMVRPIVADCNSGICVYQLAHSLFAQRFTRRLAVQQVDHDLAERQDFRKDHLGLRSWSGTSHRVEQRLAAPLAQRLSTPGRRLLTLRILRLAELGPQRPATQLLRRTLLLGRVHKGSRRSLSGPAPRGTVLLPPATALP